MGESRDIDHNKYSSSLHLWERNNDVLDHILWKYNCEGKNGGNNGGNMMYDYGLDHRELGEHFLVLTLSIVVSDLILHLFLINQLFMHGIITC